MQNVLGSPVKLEVVGCKRLCADATCPYQWLEVIVVDPQNWTDFRAPGGGLDTSAILGRGAVKDTYNLLADGIVKLAKALAGITGSEPGVWAREKGLTRYFGNSLKGEGHIDWGDKQARGTFLKAVVADADGLLQMARKVMQTQIDEQTQGRLGAAAELLAQLLLQDVERLPEGAAIKQGVSPDRVISVHDPEMRHGHKSKTRRFNGHKMAVAVDTESQKL